MGCISDFVQSFIELETERDLLYKENFELKEELARMKRAFNNTESFEKHIEQE